MAVGTRQKQLRESAHGVKILPSDIYGIIISQGNLATGPAPQPILIRAALQFHKTHESLNDEGKLTTERGSDKRGFSCKRQPRFRSATHWAILSRNGGSVLSPIPAAVAIVDNCVCRKCIIIHSEDMCKPI